MSKLRIAYLAPHNSLLMQTWAAELQKRGHTVKYFAIFPSPSRVEIPFERLPVRFGNSFLKFLLNRGIVEKALRDFGADIVHASYSTNYGLLGARQRVCPMVLSLGGSDLLIEPKRHRFFFLVNKYVLGRAAVLNPVSRHLANVIREEYGIDKRMEVLPGGIDLNVIRPPRQRPELPVRIISTRNFEPVYNISLLTQAIPAILEKTEQTEIYFWGGGTLLSQFKQQFEGSPRVFFQGWQPRATLIEALRQSHIYVSTAVSDGTSVSLLEAMACGLFPIVTDIPANREWIRDGENGFLVPVDNPSVLAEKIILAIKDSRLRKVAAEKNWQLVRKRADLQKIISKLEQIYLEITRSN